MIDKNLKNKEKNKGFFSSSFFPKTRLGELTSQQIVMLIILIVSFIIILIFFFLLDFGEISNKELCHNSVIMRSSSPLPADNLPLDCRTSYVCVTQDGSCEKMTGPEIEEVETKEEVYNALAKQLASCWWMFGEGKLNYVGDDLRPALYCSICSQLAFDDSVNEIFPDGMDKKELYDYMAIQKMPDKDYSYLEYLVGTQEVSQLGGGPNQGSNFGPMDFDKRYYIMMGIASNFDFVQAGAILGEIVGVVTFKSAGAGLSKGFATLKGVLHVNILAGLGALGGYYVGNTVEGNSGNNYLSPTLVEANSETFDGLGCKDVSTLA